MHNARSFAENDPEGAQGIRYDLDFGECRLDEKTRTINFSSLKFNLLNTYRYEFDPVEKTLTLHLMNRELIRR